jgi:hypothetical protein
MVRLMSNDHERDDPTDRSFSTGPDDDASPIADRDEEEFEEEPPPTPFDHPLFLPVLLAGGALWFGYDGWLNPETKSVMFNRYGAGVLVLAAAYFGFQAKRELDAEKRSKDDDSAQ